MTQQRLQQLSDDVRRQASREYMRRRVELTAREMRQETDEEVRQAVGRLVYGLRIGARS